MQINYKTKLIIALLSVYFVWGSTFLGVKIVLNHLTPLLANGIRFFIGGGLMLLFTLIKYKSFPAKKEVLNACFLGVLLNGLGNCGTAFGIQYIPSGIVALLTSMIPIWIVVLNFLFFDRVKPTAVAILGLFLGFLGVLILFNPFEKHNVTIKIIPLLVVMSGSVSWAIGSLKARNIQLPKIGLQSAAIQMFTGGVVGLLLSFFLENNQIEHLQNSTANTWLAMGYLIFIGSYVGYLSFLWLVKNASPQLASTYAYVNPIVALILGAIFLKERLTITTVLATLVIIGGVILMSVKKKTQ